MSRPIYRDVLQRLIEKLRTLVDFKKKIVKRGLDKAGVQQNIQILISRGGGVGGSDILNEAQFRKKSEIFGPCYCI